MITVALYNADMSFLGFTDLDQEGYVRRYAKPTTSLPQHVTLEKSRWEEKLVFEWTPSTYQGCPVYHEVNTIQVYNLRSEQ